MTGRSGADVRSPSTVSEDGEILDPPMCSDRLDDAKKNVQAMAPDTPSHAYADWATDDDSDDSDDSKDRSTRESNRRPVADSLLLEKRRLQRPASSKDDDDSDSEDSSTSEGNRRPAADSPRPKRRRLKNIQRSSSRKRSSSACRKRSSRKSGHRHSSSWCPMRARSHTHRKNWKPFLDVRVSNVPFTSRAPDIKQFFDQFFKKLPDLQKDCSTSEDAVVEVFTPKDFVKMKAGYVFVRFQNAALASTAMKMDGIMLKGRALRFNRPTTASADASFPSGFDIPALSIKSCDVAIARPKQIWVGGLNGIFRADGKALAKAMNEQLLKFPVVVETFPDIREFVIDVRLGQDGAYAFVTIANELLANSCIELGAMSLAGGCIVKMGNTKAVGPDLGERPTLDLKGSLCNVTLADEYQQGCDVNNRADVVHLGNINGIQTSSMWMSLTRVLHSLPSYRAAYRSCTRPVQDFLARRDGSALVRMADATLASTAIAIGAIWVGRRRVTLSRPTRSETGLADPLALDPARTSYCPPHSKAEALVPPVPPVPQQEVALWLSGNLHCLEPGADDLVALDSHLTRVSMRAPGYSMEQGPPVRGVSIRGGGKYAFATLRDPTTADALIVALDGTEYNGEVLTVRRARKTPGTRRVTPNETVVPAMPAIQPLWEEIDPADV